MDAESSRNLGARAWPHYSGGLTYRPHIDGLRSVAVMAVVLYHCGLAWVSGGFIGVDVFFVISGYLITGIIVRELDAERFSLAGFYERRVRRIFPALFVVIMAVFAAAALIYLPFQFREVPGSAVATLGFVSNILFYAQNGYFTGATWHKPLIHTWSLAIEEQFYLLFPLLLMLLHRFGRRRMIAVVAMLALGSFAASAWGAYRATAFAFWLAPSRAWELLAGSLLALARPPEIANRLAREVLVTAGLGMIAIAIFGYSRATPIPGAAALLPVAGTVAILHGGEGTLGGRLLSLPPAVGIGLISYSLYLWHWPILVFFYYFFATGPSRWTIIGMTAVSLLAGALSWRWIEQPFRQRMGGRPRIGRRQLFRATAAAATAIVIVSAGAWTANGWPSRFPAEAVRVAGYADSRNPRWELCNKRLDPCTYGADVTPRYALWGDSHGIELVHALGNVAARHGAAIAQYTSGACPPFLGHYRAGSAACAQFKQQVIARLEHDSDVRTVILVANFDTDDHRTNPGRFDGPAETVARLQRAGKRVVIAFPNPDFGYDASIAAAEAITYGRSREVGPESRKFFDRNKETLAFLEKVGGPSVVRIRSDRLLCGGSHCRTWIGRDLVVRDISHLTLPGAAYVAQLYEPVFASPEGRLPPAEAHATIPIGTAIRRAR